MILYSIIIPVYNRPHEVEELLESLTRQTQLNYEVIVVEDGSTLDCKEVVDRYIPQLPEVNYLRIDNSGPSGARNAGAQVARGEYLIILDSDVVLPSGYLAEIDLALQQTGADAFGGPDAAAPDFSPMQKAISYAMTSFLTTGGIRGGSATGMEQFKPRTFNMGCRKSWFDRLGGFAEDMRYGEDIDFSLRLLEAGARVCLFERAYVYHKRRVDLGQFFRQVYHSGRARIELERRHPGSTKLVHYLPSVFLIGSVLAVLSVVGSGFFFLYALIIALDAYRLNGSSEVAIRAVPACFVQLWGYGWGFLSAKLGIAE